MRRPCACAAAHRLVPPHLEMWTNTVSVGGGVSGATGAATAPAIASAALILASKWRHPAGAVAAQPRSSQARSSRRRSCRRRGGSQRCAVVVVAAAAARSAADSNDSDEAPQREGMPSCCGASCSCRRLQIRAANASNRARSHAGEPPRGCLDRRVGKSRSKIRCSSAGERCCDDTILRAAISVCFLKIDSYGRLNSLNLRTECTPYSMPCDLQYDAFLSEMALDAQMRGRSSLRAGGIRRGARRRQPGAAASFAKEVIERQRRLRRVAWRHTRRRWGQDRRRDQDRA